MNTQEENIKSEVNTKKMLKTLASEKRKVKLSERKEVEIIKDSGFYKKGQIIKPHVTFAEQLIKDKIAKEYK